MGEEDLIRAPAEEALTHAAIGPSHDDHAREALVDDASPACEGDPRNAATPASGSPRERHRPHRYTPWSKQIPIVIALLAVLLSGFSTYEGIKRSDQQDAFAARQQLTASITQLTDLQQQFYSTRTSSSLTPAEKATAYATIFTAQTVAAETARRLIGQLPKSVTADDYYALAASYARLSRWDDALTMAKAGLNIAESPTDRLSLRREMGYLYYNAGNPSLGAMEYRAALDAYHGDRTLMRFEPRQAALFTRILWSEEESAVNLCGAARTEALAAWNAARTTLPYSAVKGYIPTLKIMGNTVRSCFTNSGGSNLTLAQLASLAKKHPHKKT